MGRISRQRGQGLLRPHGRCWSCGTRRPAPRAVSRPRGPATDPDLWYVAVRAANETVLKEVEASPSKTRLGHDLDAVAHWTAAQIYLISGSRQKAVREGLRALRMAPTEPEPYFVLLRALLGSRMAQRLRRSIEPAFSEEIQEQVRRANEPMARLDESARSTTPV